MSVQSGTLELGYPTYGDITLTPTGQILGDAGSTIDFVFRVDSAAGSVINGDVVKLKNLRYELSGAFGSLSNALRGTTVQISGTFSLHLGPGLTSYVGQTHLIIDTMGSLIGSFVGLAEGSVIGIYGFEFSNSYANGDMTLSSITVPFFETSLSLESSPTFPLFNIDGIALAANVAATSGTPTGSVRFYDGANLIGIVAIVDGIAMLPLSSTDLTIGSHTITAVYAGDGGFLGSEGSVEVIVIAPSTLQGLVWVDFNNDGEVNFGERAIAGVTITLSGFDDLGNWVYRTTQTDAQGIYAFTDLRPSGPNGYTVTQSQPAGYLDGIDMLGNLGGDDSVNDVFSGIVLHGGSVAENYNFGERPMTTGGVVAGQTATIGFWQNKNGQNLIKALNGGPTATQLGNWLAATFPNMYASLAGMTNTQVAEHYKTLFARTAKTAPGGPPKVDAQIMATALAVYVTNHNLAGNTSASYGFLVTTYGVGAATFNVGSAGAAFGFANNTNASILDLLFAVNDRSHNGVLFDIDGSGTISSLEASFRTMANDVFAAINESGGN
jgi:hypothetical protein